jgi:sulfur carrier protein
MNIKINGNFCEIDDNSNLINVLDKIQIENRFGIAVAVNNVVVAKTEWEKYIVKNQDDIIIINAIFGG